MAVRNKNVINDKCFKCSEDEVLFEILLAVYSEQPVMMCVDDELCQISKPVLIDTVRLKKLKPKPFGDIFKRH